MASNKATYRITGKWPWMILDGECKPEVNEAWKEEIREQVRQYAQPIAEDSVRLIIIMRQVTPLQLHEALTEFELGAMGGSGLTDFTVVRRAG